MSNEPAPQAYPHVAAMDALPAEEAAALLTSCCGSEEWVRRMLARRPFRATSTMLAVAEREWWSLGAVHWYEAFTHHPRIGERSAAVAQDSRAASWSEGEQRAVSASTGDVRRALSDGNAEYERRFGHIYLSLIHI